MNGDSILRASELGPWGISAATGMTQCKQQISVVLKINEFGHISSMSQELNDP